MKIKVKLRVSKKAYYNHLCEGIINDIKKNTKTQITLKQLEDGYAYKKKMLYKKETVYIDMKAGPMEKDKFFIVSYETMDTRCTYSYDFISQEDVDYVIYTEDNRYKKETFLNKFGEFKRKIKAKGIQNKAFNNIELTQRYIENKEN